jgi:hypothetical protein
VQDGKTNRAIGTKAEVSSPAYGTSGQFNFEEEAMSEENNNAKMSEPESTADDSRKLSEDARGLGPRQAGRIRIGVLDMIVGESGLEVPGYKTTKYETLQLVRHWAGEILGLDFGFFLYGSVGSSEWRIREYANRRLNTIAKSIGEEEVKKAFKQAEEAFAKGADPQAWKIFMEDTREEQESFQEEVQRKLAGDPASDKHKPPEPTKDPYSQETLQRAYEMYEQGAKHISVMNETGLDRKTALWLSVWYLAGLGIPAVKPVTIVDTELDDEL